MSPPPPPPPPPPLCLPSLTRKGKPKKRHLDEFFDEKSASSHPSGLHSRSSRGSRGSQSPLLASRSPSQAESPQAGSPLVRFASYSPTATFTASDQSKAEITSRAEKPTSPEDTPESAPKLDRSRTKPKRRGIFRCKFGGWGLCFGRRDKDKDDLITETDRSSSATTILPVFPRGEAPFSFVTDDAQIPTRHISQRSKISHASKHSKASRATKPGNLSGGSKRSSDSRSDSANTLSMSALERMETYQDIREYKDTTT